MVEKDKSVKAPVKSRKNFLSQQLMLIVAILLAAAFLPVSLTLFVGMLPTMVAFLVDTSRDKTRSLTVGLLNFVACFPFLMDVALDQNTMPGAMATLSQPMNLIVMYVGAAAGYFLDWTLVGVSNVMMTARARQRVDYINKRQEDLIRRWGREVTGDIPLDPQGFPLSEHRHADDDTQKS